MKDYCKYRMELNPRNELETGLVLYGENEPPESENFTTMDRAAAWEWSVTVIFSSLQPIT